MDNYTDHQGGYTSLYVTLLSAAGAVVNFIVAHFSRNDIPLFLGSVATIVAIIAGVTTIRANNTRKRRDEMEMELMKRKYK